MSDPTTGSVPPQRLLNVPHKRSVTFERNYIRVAVAELKFPELPAINDATLNSVRVHLRPEYPIPARSTTVSVESDKVETQPEKRMFKSRHEDWIVALSTASISVETPRYTTFEDLSRRVAKLIDWTEAYRDSDFFTRVGLRYVNVIPFRDPHVDLTEWINPLLVQPLADGIYGEVSTFSQVITGVASGGKYTFRHGYVPDAAGPDAGVPGYVLDFDLYDENLGVAEAVPLLSGLHEQSFDFFHWAIGPEALASLGAAKPKKER